jgi:hypothetical protein
VKKVWNQTTVMILEAFVLNNFRLNANFFQGGEGVCSIWISLRIKKWLISTARMNRIWKKIVIKHIILKYHLFQGKAEDIYSLFIDQTYPYLIPVEGSSPFKHNHRPWVCSIPSRAISDLFLPFSKKSKILSKLIKSNIPPSSFPRYEQC